MSTQSNPLASILQDPEFLKLSDTDKAFVLGKVKESQQPKLTGVDEYGRSYQDVINNPQFQQGERGIMDKVIEYGARPVLPKMGATAAAAYSGPAAPVAGPIAYTTIDMLLQRLKSKPTESLTGTVTGVKPGSIISDLMSTGEQALLNKAGEKVIGDVAKGVKGYYSANQPEILKFIPTTGQALTATGSKGLGGMATFIEDVFATGSKAAALDKSAGAGFSQAVKMADIMGQDPNGDLLKLFNFGPTQQTEKLKPISESIFKNPQELFDRLKRFLPNEEEKQAIRVIKGAEYQPLRKGKHFELATPAEIQGGQVTIKPYAETMNQLDSVIDDSTKLQEVLSRASQIGTGYNLKRSLQAYKFSKMMNDVVVPDVKNPNAFRLDPQKLLNTWGNPDMQKSLSVLYNSKQRSDITQFFRNVAYSQEKMISLPLAKGLLVVRGGGMLAASLFTGSMAGSGFGTGLMGLFVGGGLLGKLLTNPSTARLMVNMAAGAPLGVSEQYAGRVIARALRGSIVGLMTPDGNTVPARVEEDKFVPLEQ